MFSVENYIFLTEHKKFLSRVYFVYCLLLHYELRNLLNYSTKIKQLKNLKFNKKYC